MTMALAPFIAEQYINAYNEWDAAARRAAVAALWTDDAEHIGGFSARGHDEISAGIGKVQESAAPAAARFRLRPGFCSRDEILVMLWDLVTEAGDVIGSGATVAVTTPGGRISTEYVYEFADKDPAQASSQELAERYVNAWNEPDDGVRAEVIRGLWTPSGVHIGGFVGTGYGELLEGINESHQRHVLGNNLRFRARQHAMRRRDTIFFVWDAEPVGHEGSPVATGLQVLQLGDDEKVQKDYTLMMAGTD
jgi:hypothetical protein